MRRGHEGQARWRGVASLAAIGVVAFVAWVATRTPAPPLEAQSSVSPAPAEPATPRHARGESRPPSTPREVADDGIPIMSAGAHDSSEHEPKHPHPHTSAHERIYRENTLHGLMHGAMNVKDHLGLRALVETYRDEYPEDEHRLAEGFSIIADCLEEATPERRRAAEHYWKTKRGSTLRRFIRRHCLEASHDSL